MCASVFCRGRNRRRRRNHGNCLIYSDDTDVAALPFAVIHDATLAPRCVNKRLHKRKKKDNCHTNTPCEFNFHVLNGSDNDGRFCFFPASRYLESAGVVQPSPAQPEHQRLSSAKTQTEEICKVNLCLCVCVSICPSVSLIRSLDRLSRRHTGLRRFSSLLYCRMANNHLKATAAEATAALCSPHKTIHIHMYVQCKVKRSRAHEVHMMFGILSFSGPLPPTLRVALV